MGTQSELVIKYLGSVENSMQITLIQIKLKEIVKNVSIYM